MQGNIPTKLINGDASRHSGYVAQFINSHTKDTSNQRCIKVLLIPIFSLSIIIIIFIITNNRHLKDITLKTFDSITKPKKLS